jgi:hypothetical protein
MAAPMVQVNVRVDPDLYASLKKRAGKDGQTVTAAISDAIRNYLSTTQQGGTP